ncbi:hypothetical protein [Salinisphaera sp. Q1T1-3]|uniref:hypothetical protein n=1 Tax=Salinisphaera sp. Q1T1-3 TaxID=2321229 RepID=UPI0011C43FEF|nr:hypothetical protein [Salinisphaera sp. Q1T1-3]
MVWLSVPGNAPDDADPWAQLRASAALGESQGMALPAMLYALAAYGRSDVAREREAIETVARIHNRYQPSSFAEPADKDGAEKTAARYRLLNEIAYNEALYSSDRLWIDATGHRTPLMALGRFPGARSETNDDADFDAGRYLN